jgi:hypothetical protein
VNLHNYFFDAGARRIVISVNQGIAEDVQKDPANRVLFLTGDLNFLAPGEGVSRRLKDGTTTRSRHQRNDSRRSAPLLWKFVECSRNNFTRFGGVGNPILSHIDRVYVSWPPWIVRQLQATATTMRPVTSVEAQP